MRTASTRREDAQHDWYVVDAEGRTLGRLASEIAKRLRGKHKPEYTPHVDTGDYIVVVNAAKVKVTGRKETDKVYYRHSGYPGGIKATPLDKMREHHPDRILGNAVRGMLPRNPLGRAMLRKLKIYAGPSHPHASQQPKALEL
ncbi:MAG: 50S ribosomal protein L13 [Gammaproteobacteria bacterium]|nr:50S ribosomal protein L13 [Gammaproteobacteria bacterium]